MFARLCILYSYTCIKREREREREGQRKRELTWEGRDEVSHIRNLRGDFNHIGSLLQGIALMDLATGLQNKKQEKKPTTTDEFDQPLAGSQSPF